MLASMHVVDTFVTLLYNGLANKSVYIVLTYGRGSFSVGSRMLGKLSSCYCSLKLVHKEAYICIHTVVHTILFLMKDVGTKCMGEF